MRRKSARNAQKATPEKVVKEAETPPKTRRSRRRKRSPSKSSDSEEEVLTVTKRAAPVEETPDTTTKSHSPTDEEGSEEPVWKVTSSEDTPKGEIQKLKICLTRPSPDSPDKNKTRRSKSNSQTEDDATSSEDKSSTRRTRSRGSTNVTNDGLSSQEGDEDVEEKKGKGKSKGKHKSKIEKSPHLSEPEIQPNNEISENVQVTPQSPSIDKPVNENDYKVDDLQNINESVQRQQHDESRNSDHERDGNKTMPESQDESDDEPLSVIQKHATSDKQTASETQEEQTTEETQKTDHMTNKPEGQTEIDNKVCDQTPEKPEEKPSEIVAICEDSVKHTQDISTKVDESQENIEMASVEEKSMEATVINEVTTESQPQIAKNVIESEDVSMENIETTETTPEVPAKKLPEKTSEVAVEEPREKTLEKPREKTPEVPARTPREKTPEVPPRKLREKTPEVPVRKSREKTPEVPVRKSRGKTPEVPVRKPREKTPEVPPRKSREKTPDVPVKKQREKTPEVPVKKSHEDTLKIPVSSEVSKESAQKDRQQDDQDRHRSPRRILQRNNEYLKSDSKESEETPESSHIKPKKIKRTWDLSLISVPSLLKIDLESIQIIFPNIDFPEEPDLNLELEKERRKSLDSVKKLERKVSVEYKSDTSERPSFEKQNSVNSTAQDSEDNSNIIAFNRKISIVDDTASKLKPPPSPAKNPPSNILFITNLVRPFTVKQLKELLERTGKVQEDGFWTDRIKSKCYVQYEAQEEAEATRNALHGVQWPIGNGKKLIIDFATAEDMENAKNPPAPPPPAPVPDVKVSAKENLEPVESKPRSEEKSRKEMEKKRTDGPVREWDIGKKDMRRSRSRDRSRKHRRSPSPSEDFITRKQRKAEESAPQKLMDDLFLKTKATPSIYWQPLSPEEISMKQQQRLIRMEEHKRRMEENSRMKGREMGRGAFRRRYD